MLMRWLGALVVGAVMAGCGPRSMPAGYAGDDARAFVREHRAELEAEIAAGSGPRLYDLAIVANCQDVPQLGRRLHKRRAELFTAPADGETEGAAPEAPPAPVSDEVAAERVVRFLSENRELRCLSLEVGRGSQFAAGRRQIGPRRGPTTARGGTP